MLNAIKTVVEGKVVIKLEGKLDTVTSRDLETKLNEFIGSIDELVFDFEKLDYISSAGLRLMVSTSKKLGGMDKLTIINVKQGIKDVFHVTGFDNILNIKE